MQKIKQTSLINELCDHIEISLLVKTYAHVKHNIGMSQLVQHLDLLNEILQSFLGQVSLPKPLYSNPRTHPACLIDISITTSANEVLPLIDLHLLELNEEVKAILFE